MTRATCLSLALPLALLALAPACRRSEPPVDAQGAAREAALMPRAPEQQNRADTTGPQRIKCKEVVESVPCGP